MNGRKNPEGGLGPEFIRVVYDEKGNPVAVKPADVSVTSQFIPDKNPTNTTSIIRPIPQPLEQWLTLISKNILSLKADIERTQNSYSQLYNQFVAEIKNINIPSPATPDIDFKPLVQPLTQQISEQKILYKLLADQINTMNEIISTIAREISLQKTFTEDMTNNLSNTLSNKIELLNDTFASIRTITKEVDALRNDSMQRFSYVDEKLLSMHRQVAASNDRTEADLIAINDIMTVMNERIAEVNEKMNDFNEKISYLQNMNYATPEDLQNVKEDLMNAIEQSSLDKHLLIEEIVARTSQRMKGMIAKKTKVEVRIKVKKRKSRKVAKVAKRKIKKVRKHVKKRTMKRKLATKIKVRKSKKPVVKIRKVAKIRKGMIRGKLKRYGIVDYGNALVVTERNMQKYGRAVFDIARKMNNNMIMIMQEKMSEEDGFDQTTYDAMDNSEAVFIVTNRNMKKNFAVKNASLRKRVFVVDKKMKFSEVKY